MSNSVDKTVTKFISDDSGSGLFAKEDLGVGDRIAHVADPFVLIPDRKSITRACYECLRSTSKLSDCTGCRTVKYCSKACQRTSWKRIHKLECKIFRALIDNGYGVLPTPTRAVLQVLLLRRSSDMEVDSRWNQLISHKEKIMRRDEMWTEVVLQARAAIAYAGLQPDAMDVATSIMCCIKVNSFTASYESGLMALCFEPVLARANHSCVPNAYVSFDGRDISLTTLASIRKDEEIKITYIDFTGTRGKRIQQLEEYYFFTCKCPKCTGDWNVYTAFLKNPSREANRLSIVTDYDDLVIMTQRLSQISLSNKGPEEALIDGLADVAMDLETTEEKFAAFKVALYKLPVLSEIRLLAEVPYSNILKALIGIYERAHEREACLILLLISIFHVDPIRLPEPWREDRLAHLEKVVSILTSMLASYVFYQPNLEVVPTSVTFDVPACLYSVLLVIAGNTPNSGGRAGNSHLSKQVREAKEQMESHIQFRHHADCAILMTHSIKEGKGRETALRHLRQLETLADIKLMYRVIDTVDCKGNGHKTA